MKSNNSSKDEQKDNKNKSDDKIQRMSEALRQNLKKKKSISKEAERRKLNDHNV